MQSNRKVLVAMSGGVDSSVAASLLLEAGHELIGVTMRVVPDPPDQSPFAPCCSLEAVNDARHVADTLGFPHYVVNFLEEFDRHVIQNFVDEYRAGRTPNPCVRCNEFVKFGALLAKADEYGASHIATGHYVRLEQYNGRFALRRAAYRPKDQSYALACLDQPLLARAMFPLGNLDKAATRERARALGLVTADKPESQEICFVPDDNYRNFLLERGIEAQPGPILSLDGTLLGEHHGLIHYTVGQRKGLGVAAPRPLYVVRLDPDRNAVIVAHEEDTACAGLLTENVVWGASGPVDAPFRCLAQIRYLHTPVPCLAIPQGDRFELRFETPLRAVAPGQWAVLYDDHERVLAGGVIRQSF